MGSKHYESLFSSSNFFMKYLSICVTWKIERRKVARIYPDKEKARYNFRDGEETFRDGEQGIVYEGGQGSHRIHPQC